MLMLTHQQTGEVTRLTNLSFLPLDFSRLVDSVQNKRTTVITTVEGDLCDEAENVIGDRVKCGFEIKLNDRVPFFCLVAGGVLPPAYVTGIQDAQFLLDRNVIGKIEANVKEVVDELKKLDSDRFAFDTLPACFESAEQRCPTEIEMKAEFQRFNASVSGLFDNATVTTYSDDQLTQLHNFRSTFEPSHQIEKDFFRQVAPLVASTIRADQLEGVKKQIISIADSTGLKKDSFLFVASLSKLYENYESCGNTANKVLKPRISMSEEDLYNVVADLRHLKMLAASRVFHDQSFVMLTDDTGLAMLWAGLQISNAQQADGGGSRVDFFPHEDLFPRADYEVIRKLLVV